MPGGFDHLHVQVMDYTRGFHFTCIPQFHSRTVQFLVRSYFQALSFPVQFPVQKCLVVFVLFHPLDILGYDISRLLQKLTVRFFKH